MDSQEGLLGHGASTSSLQPRKNPPRAAAAKSLSKSAPKNPSGIRRATKESQKASLRLGTKTKIPESAAAEKAANQPAKRVKRPNVMAKKSAQKSTPGSVGVQKKTSSAKIRKSAGKAEPEKGATGKKAKAGKTSNKKEGVGRKGGNQKETVASGSGQKGVAKKKTKPRAKPKKRRRILTPEEVLNKLKNAGVKKLDKVSGCLKAAILRGFMQLDCAEDLKAVILDGACEACDRKIKVTMKKILYQKDWGLDEYTGLSDDAPIRCAGCSQRFFVGEMCTGEPQLLWCKWMNHCNKCPFFGICIRESRDIHCDTCDEHYYCGASRQQVCATCHPEEDARYLENLMGPKLFPHNAASGVG
ncbi:uncharacterized protein LOC129583572 [Paramacrobiotus metropolitanus]|uniref:uncharacterized protein LOC129583572 n=1 Tax=Paramacrobiotus metropolitanus TaxID=2943436 RepID=UPI0024463057|nr:uncharacterized protein LOC129583572 [Paramacrobiotus metropolitanus]XP_055331391.1 uncharacterized protein LOC129583572 [Paramacrobiotus metropolitanus]XP_055331392.1 uncharacterized protein LOC129583572 [Paramacrobiotus metropolitanus]XP_055331393.1 uncharacterized protein LOC129583572 [Paramacrobiotus metropolitanus]